jgi:cysteine-S-conjugate beta-lyase
MKKSNKRPATILVHQGQDRDPATGAATVPIYQASTYHHPGGVGQQFDYARSGNPSRQQVEDAIALLEGGSQGFAYASGMAAIGGALSLLQTGDHLIAPDDLYGGTYRYLTLILPQQGIEVTLVDQADPAAVRAAIRPNTRALLLETPSNPLFKISDIRALAEIAREHRLLSLIDNTFMTPLLQRPLELGIDVVIHSATKFLGGHSDLLAGLTTVTDPELAKQLKRFQNAFGPVLGPFDCFLLSRGIKTLKLRLEEGERNAAELARRLERHPAVSRVIYPGLESFAQRELHFSQATGAGAVLSFELRDADRVKPLLETVALPIIAPSLGGVETILTHCWSMSHAAIPAETKQAAGIGPGLLRISAGIEDIEDLWEDLAAGLSAS